MSESVAAANAGLNAKLVPGTTYYVSLATADPGPTGLHEFTTVTRQPITMASASGGTQASNLAASIPNGGTQTATHEMIWSAVTAGNFISSGQLVTPSTGTPISLPSGSVTRSES